MHSSLRSDSVTTGLSGDFLGVVVVVLVLVVVVVEMSHTRLLEALYTDCL